MPGINVVASLNGNLHYKSSLIAEALNLLISYRTNYQQEILLQNNVCFLGVTRYQEYPIKVFDTDDFFICLEGYIYSSTETSLRAELINFAKSIFQTDTVETEALTQRLLSTDGDFILFILEKRSHKIAILNDALGRLPFYYFQSGKDVIVSRDLRFVANVANSKTADRMAIAQVLLFSYPLGKRTLLNDIERIDPATLFVLDQSRQTAEVYRLHSCFNLEQKKYGDRSLDENSAELVSLFTQSCRNRANVEPDHHNIIALSGGLDSRTIVAGFKTGNLPFTAFTFVPDLKEEKTAIEIAQALNINHSRLVLSPPQGKHLTELLRIKNGLNSLDVVRFVQAYRGIQSIYGSKVTYFDGSGGDKLIPDLRPRRKIASIEELVDFIAFKMPHIFNLDFVTSMVKDVSKDEMLDEIYRRVSSYPEADLSQKYVHFLLYERAFKRLFEADDRSRSYFWGVSPFYSVEFFNYAINCPDEQKNQYKLYRSFLLKLSPQAAAINYANKGAAITSLKFKVFEQIKFEFLSLLQNVDHKNYEFLKKIRRQVTKTESANLTHNLTLIDCLRKQLKNCGAISDCFSRAAVENVIENYRSYSRRQILWLLTLTASIEDLESNKSVFEDYCDDEFVI